MRDWSDGGESDELVAKEKRGNQHSPDDLFMVVGVGPTRPSMAPDTKIHKKTRRNCLLSPAAG